MDASNLLGRYRIVPVVVIDNADAAITLAETLLHSGIRIMEITLRSDDALKSIENVAKRVPDMLIGAGSVRNAGQFVDVSRAGAKFVVSPGATYALTDAAASSQLPYVPGAATPSEMLALLELGYRLQKLFPAEAAGGIDLLKSVAGPIPEVRFMPTGGISVERAPDYLALPNVSGVGGSWITPPDLIAGKHFDRIAKLAAHASRIGT
jgi:2-dehydro-3-deoxyphosphogluconate aldolase/(4S)-4-hydroxy-2-oxoglutarate aldolase